MLLPDNIHPTNSIYYNGAKVLQVIQDQDCLTILELYQKVKEIQNMTLPVFVLSLDWLYLIDVITLKSGKIKLCS